jgi:CRISPR-associated exonuclease Cas4
MYAEADLLPLSGVQHMAFCPRRAALIYMEGAWDENVMTAEGRVLHERVHETGHESRRELRIAYGLRCRSLHLGLSGQLDVVEFHLLDGPTDAEGRGVGATLPGVEGWWAPYPIEYKRGEKRHELSFEIQLCAQIMSLEEMLGVEIPQGALFYGKSARRQDVVMSPALRETTEEIASKYHALVDSRRTPAAVLANKCAFCSLNPRCMPKAMQKHPTLDRYIAAMLKAGEKEGP